MRATTQVVLLGLALNGFAAPLKLATQATKAKDGSTIIDDTVTINGLKMRFKISAPDSEIIGGANNNKRAAGTLGVNVLFHGDGGQSFFDFPNQGVNANLMGVALLAPNQDLRWGGEDPKDNTGLVRPDGPAHSAAVNEFLTKVLPTKVNFDNKKIFLEGVSGGSLLLSGFMIPTFAASLGVPGALLGCGGLEPQVAVKGDISNIRLHFQSTQNDLATLKTSIPKAILAYEKLSNNKTTLVDNGAPLVTADASPNGGHCEFDEKAFVSGVQLLTDNFQKILNGDSGVAHSVQGNENIYNAAQVKAAAANAAKASASAAAKNGNKVSSFTTTAAANSKATSGSNNGETTITTTNAQGQTVVRVIKTVTVEKNGGSQTTTSSNSKQTSGSKGDTTVTVTKQVVKTVTVKDAAATKTVVNAGATRTVTNAGATKTVEKTKTVKQQVTKTVTDAKSTRTVTNAGATKTVEKDVTKTVQKVVTKTVTVDAKATQGSSNNQQNENNKSSSSSSSSSSKETTSSSNNAKETGSSTLTSSESAVSVIKLGRDFA